MVTRTIAAVSLVMSLLLSGCANIQPMAFSKHPDIAPDSNQAIFLMTATIKNTYKTRFQPDLLFVIVDPPVVKDSQDELSFKIDDEGSDETDEMPNGNTYFIRLNLPPGTYTIQGLRCISKHFPIIAGYFVPLHEKLVVTNPGVYYLGHVDATLRERVGDEFKAGSTIPLIDQAVGGASGGTFDIKISDGETQDEAEFDKRFPGLKGVKIEKDIMAPFDRAYAQKWWDTH